MYVPGTPTFEQLRIFLTVAEEGSFAAAAKRLGRAVSVVSYAVANLETELGIELFDRQNTRRPSLTSSGKAVLQEARTIARGFDNLQARARSLLSGFEAEVDLAVDVMLPCDRIGRTLRAFRERFPSIALRLNVEALGAVAARVSARDSVIGISGPLCAEFPEIERVLAGNVPLVPVAAHDHPLAGWETVPAGEGRNHTQLVLSDRSGSTDGRDFSVLSPQVWRVADMGSKHALLLEGIGWGNMPLPLVERDLAEGKLRRLSMVDQPGGTYRFCAIWRRDTPPGPAAQWLIDRFVELGRADVALPGLVDL